MDFLEIMKMRELLGAGHPRVKAMLAQHRHGQQKSMASPVVKSALGQKPSKLTDLKVSFQPMLQKDKPLTLRLKDGRVVTGEQARKMFRARGY